MSLLDTDSYDDRATAQLDSRAVVAQTGSVIQSGGVCGTNCYANSTSGGGIEYGVDSNGSITAQIGMAYNHGNGAFECEPLFIGGRNGGATRMAFIRALSSSAGFPNVLEFWTGVNFVLGDFWFRTPNNTLPTNSTYVFIEYRVVFDNVAGEVQAWLDGVELFHTTGVDTLNGFSSGLPWATYGVSSTNGLGRCVDNVYAMNGDGVAPVNGTVSLAANAGATGFHVFSLLPQTDAVAGGGLREWTPLSGTDHGAMVDEAPPDGDTSYLFTQVEGAEELFRFPEIVTSSPIVYGVQSGIVAKKSNYGNTEMITIAQEGFGAVTDGVRWGVASENYLAYRQMWDPPAGGTWTITKVADTEFGMRHTRVRS